MLALFTLTLLHSPIFDAGFLNVGASMNKLGNSHKTREMKSLVLTHSFLYFTLVFLSGELNPMFHPSANGQTTVSAHTFTEYYASPVRPSFDVNVKNNDIALTELLGGGRRAMAPPTVRACNE